eukprot:Rhum_TRINITY_DN12460_c0_g1::Rhum_TRINITY_DN12460_c0_g1_i1::g.51605::m.51605
MRLPLGQRAPEHHHRPELHACERAASLAQPLARLLQRVLAEQVEHALDGGVAACAADGRPPEQHVHQASAEDHACQRAALACKLLELVLLAVLHVNARHALRTVAHAAVQPHVEDVRNAVVPLLLVQTVRHRQVVPLARLQTLQPRRRCVVVLRRGLVQIVCHAHAELDLSRARRMRRQANIRHKTHARVVVAECALQRGSARGRVRREVQCLEAHPHRQRVAAVGTRPPQDAEFRQGRHRRNVVPVLVPGKRDIVVGSGAAGVVVRRPVPQGLEAVRAQVLVVRVLHHKLRVVCPALPPRHAAHDVEHGCAEVVVAALPQQREHPLHEAADEAVAVQVERVVRRRRRHHLHDVQHVAVQHRRHAPVRLNHVGGCRHRHRHRRLQHRGVVDGPEVVAVRRQRALHVDARRQPVVLQDRLREHLVGQRQRGRVQCQAQQAQREEDLRPGQNRVAEPRKRLRQPLAHVGLLHGRGTLRSACGGGGCGHSHVGEKVAQEVPQEVLPLLSAGQTALRALEGVCVGDDGVDHTDALVQTHEAARRASHRLHQRCHKPTPLRRVALARVADAREAAARPEVGGCAARLLKQLHERLRHTAPQLRRLQRRVGHDRRRRRVCGADVRMLPVRARRAAQLLFGALGRRLARLLPRTPEGLSGGACGLRRAVRAGDAEGQLLDGGVGVEADGRELADGQQTVDDVVLGRDEIEERGDGAEMHERGRRGRRQVHHEREQVEEDVVAGVEKVLHACAVPLALPVQDRHHAGDEPGVAPAEAALEERRHNLAEACDAQRLEDVGRARLLQTQHAGKHTLVALEEPAAAPALRKRQRGVGGRRRQQLQHALQVEDEGLVQKAGRTVDDGALVVRKLLERIRRKAVCARKEAALHRSVKLDVVLLRHNHQRVVEPQRVRLLVPQVLTGEPDEREEQAVQKVLPQAEVGVAVAEGVDEQAEGLSVAPRQRGRLLRQDLRTSRRRHHHAASGHRRCAGLHLRLGQAVVVSAELGARVVLERKDACVPVEQLAVAAARHRVAEAAAFRRRARVAPVSADPGGGRCSCVRGASVPGGGEHAPQTLPRVAAGLVGEVEGVRARGDKLVDGCSRQHRCIADRQQHKGNPHQLPQLLGGELRVRLAGVSVAEPAQQLAHDGVAHAPLEVAHQHLAEGEARDDAVERRFNETDRRQQQAAHVPRRRVRRVNDRVGDVQRHVDEPLRVPGRGRRKQMRALRRHRHKPRQAQRCARPLRPHLCRRRRPASHAGVGGVGKHSQHGHPDKGAVDDALRDAAAVPRRLQRHTEQPAQRAEDETPEQNVTATAARGARSGPHLGCHPRDTLHQQHKRRKRRLRPRRAGRHRRAVRQHQIQARNQAAGRHGTAVQPLRQQRRLRRQETGPLRKRKGKVLDQGPVAARRPRCQRHAHLPRRNQPRELPARVCLRSRRRVRIVGQQVEPPGCPEQLCGAARTRSHPSCRRCRWGGGGGRRRSADARLFAVHLSIARLQNLLTRPNEVQIL